MILGGSHITTWEYRILEGSCRTLYRLSMDSEHRFLLPRSAMICQAPVCPMDTLYFLDAAVPCALHLYVRSLMDSPR